MPTTSIVRAYRAGFALLSLAAIATQLVSLVGRGTFNPVGYFSYFTIDSNLIAAGVLLAGSAARRAGAARVSEMVRGAAVVYMSVTGLVFTLLLSGTDVDTAIPWVNTVVHELMPLVVVADWILVPPREGVRMRRALLWLLFPLAWILYTLVRGAATGRYPYPFLNPVNGGYGSVAAYSVAVAVLVTIVCAVVAWLSRARAGAAGVSPRPERTSAGPRSTG